MPQIPENTVTIDDIILWSKMKQELATLKTNEMLLRTKIAKSLFPNPKEGTNKDYNFGITLTHKIDRTIDEATLSNLTRMLHENNVPVDELVNYKPSLVLSAYRKLDAEQLKLFDNVLIVKPGSPALKIEEVKQ